jgi:hypothetical protein
MTDYLDKTTEANVILTIVAAETLGAGVQHGPGRTGQQRLQQRPGKLRASARHHLLGSNGLSIAADAPILFELVE